MNAIRQTQQLNRRELENATPPSASWHADYRDTAWIYVGGLPLDLTEGDVVTIFSQFGNPTHLNLIRDRETGKSKGFGFLKYEDQRSCDLAVDNFTGADVLGRLLRVDHTRYKKKDDEDEDTYRIERLEAEADAETNGKRASDTEESEEERRRRKKRRPMLKEEMELEKMLAIKQNGEDEEDPMRDYLLEEKREEVRRARDRERDGKHKHRHRQSYEDEDDERRSRRHRHKDQGKDPDDKDRDTERHQVGGDRDVSHRHRHRSRSKDYERDLDRKTYYDQDRSVQRGSRKDRERRRLENVH